MKTIIKATVMMMLFALTVKAQHMHQMKSDAKEQKNEMIKMMGDPVFEQSAEGIMVQVWLITQEEHKKKMSENQKEMKHDMKDMKHGDMKMDQDMKGMEHGDMKMDDDKKHDSDVHSKMMEGTHHIMVVVSDETTKKPVENAELEIESTSPSKVTGKTKLTLMMNHFGGGLSIEEKGEYSFTVVVKSGKKIVKLPMVYNLK